MNALPTLTALAPITPTRANATMDANATDGASGEAGERGSGFADALEQAREPKAKAKAAAKNAARAQALLRAEGAERPDRNAVLPIEPAAPRPGASPDLEAAPDAAEDPRDAAAPDLGALLPGWPATPLAPPTPAAAASAGANTPAPMPARGDGRTEIDGLVHLTAAAVGTPGVGTPRSTKAALATPIAPREEATAGVPRQDGRPALTPTLRSEPAAPLSPTLSSPAAPSTQPSSGADAPASARDNPPAPIAGAPVPSAVPAPATAQGTAPANATAPPATPGAPVEARLTAAFDTPAFAPALATQITWLVNEGVQHARLTLNPQEMGPLMVKIVLDGSQARIDFSADLAATRAAIETSLPSLAAALHDNGLTLAGGGVFDGQARQGAPEGRAAQTRALDARSEPTGIDPSPLPAAAVRSTRGLVDLVA